MFSKQRVYEILEVAAPNDRTSRWVDVFILTLISLNVVAVIVETIISMARSLDLEVVAEGVETAEAFAALKLRSCLVFQGHYFSHPVSEDRMKEMLEAGPVIPAGEAAGVPRINSRAS